MRVKMNIKVKFIIYSFKKVENSNKYFEKFFAASVT